MKSGALLCFLVALASVACAKKQHSAPSAIGAVNPDQVFQTESPSKANQVAQNTIVTCGDAGGCLPAVGMLTVTDESEVSACTASLIGPDLVLTNSHCIPDDLSAPGSSCAGRIWLSFPKDPAHPAYERQVPCSQVLVTTDISGENPRQDYALLRLSQPSARPPLQIGRSGFADGELLSLSKVDPEPQVDVGGFIRGNLHTVTCAAVQDTLLLPSSTTNLSDLMVFSGCAIIHGNSGSALRASDGTVRGVIQAFFDMDLVNDRLKQIKITENDPQLDQLNLGTNLACVSEIEPSVLPSACASPARNQSIVLEDNPKNESAYLHAAFAQAMTASAAATGPLRFEPGPVQENNGVDPEPECLLRNAAYNKSYRLLLPHFELLFGVDSFMRLGYRLKSISTEPAEVEVGKRAGETEVDMGWNQMNTWAFRGTVPRCSR